MFQYGMIPDYTRCKATQSQLQQADKVSASQALMEGARAKETVNLYAHPYAYKQILGVKRNPRY